MPSTSATDGSRTSGRGKNRSRNSEPERYDFLRPTKLAREHIRTLQLAYETFARGFGTVLTTTTRVISQVNLVSIEQHSYEEYISTQAATTVLAMCTLEPLPGTTMVQFPVSLGMLCLDHMLGGPGGPQPERELTDIETPLLRRMIGRILDELVAGLDTIVAIKPQLRALEYNPQFANAGVPTDAMIVTSFEVKVGEEGSVATICMPFNAIFPHLQGERTDVTLSDSQRQARQSAYRSMVAGLQSAPIDVRIRFRSVRIHAVDLVNLRPGDVVPLTHPTTAPLAVTAAGITFAYAVPGNKGPRMACLVVPSPADHEETRR